MIAALWRRVWSECWLGHERPRVIEFDKDGRLLLVCPRCRHAIVVNLAGETP